jgi:hypothetical protein
MTKLQLSDAIRLGSFVMAYPRAGDIDRCAITMALHAHGAVPDPTNVSEPNEFCLEEGDDQAVNTEPLPVRPSEAYSANFFHALRFHEALTDIYSWLDKIFACPWCGEGGRILQGTQVVYHPFDDHVMTGEITLDAFCSWIALIEPAPETYGITLNLGLGVRFASEVEKESIIRAAAEAGLSPNAYIAASVRLVMEYRLPLEEFQCPDPVIGLGQNVNWSAFSAPGTPVG